MAGSPDGRHFIASPGAPAVSGARGSAPMAAFPALGAETSCNVPQISMYFVWPKIVF